MRPISSFSMMNVLGGAAGSGVALQPDRHENTLRIMAKRQAQSRNGLREDAVEISQKAKELERSLQRGGLHSAQLGEVSRAVEEVANSEELAKAEEQRAVVEIGRQQSEGLHQAAEEEKVRDLEERDRQVRQREEAHARAAGNLAKGGPRYTYEIGPDGKRYAVEGHTEIQVKSGNTPEERLRNARRAQQAARAGGGMTPQSARVANEAKREAEKAREEIEEERSGDTQDSPSAVDGRAILRSEKDHQLPTEGSPDAGGHSPTEAMLKDETASLLVQRVVQAYSQQSSMQGSGNHASAKSNPLDSLENHKLA